MYTPPAFAMDQDAALALVEARRFATLVSPSRRGDGGSGLQATALPLLLDRTETGWRLLGHIARANPHWRDFDPAASSLAIFDGGDAYVSPSWYPAKALHHKVVPTWNYRQVHIHGRLSVTEDPALLMDIITGLTTREEAGLPSPWAVTDAPADFIAAQLRGIVGLVLTVERVEGKAKLSQNRPPADRASVAKALAGRLDIPVPDQGDGD
ncbi:FMN-binding negative transcriptional regulator [Niveispirillum irakense]|uniref:FMN-binding negative transcriptional regulator n=1 Tax=Niveispirillum irakense TaxID=34011 RepID=UPI0003FBA99E|nr:FMN-binding negative transcriptional regulator [Niveispirillum irakense]